MSEPGPRLDYRALCSNVAHDLDSHLTRPQPHPSDEDDQMTRGEFNLALQCDLRAILNKHEKEREAVRHRNALAATAPVFSGKAETERFETAQRMVIGAGDQLDMAIYVFCDRLYDLVKGEKSE